MIIQNQPTQSRNANISVFSFIPQRQRSFSVTEIQILGAFPSFGKLATKILPKVSDFWQPLPHKCLPQRDEDQIAEHN